MKPQTESKVPVVVDIHDFLRGVEMYPSAGWVFRGQADGSLPLRPKAGRPDFFYANWEDQRHGMGTSGQLPPQDLNMFREWRETAVAFTERLPDDDFECLAYAQHYGLATRLLDWTANPLTALYFAVETCADSDGAVFAYLCDHYLNPSLDVIGKLGRVALYEPRPFDRRILCQSAMLTYHPKPEVPLTPSAPTGERASLAPAGCNLVKFLIPAAAKPPLRLHLSDIGITRKALFPDLEGLSAYTNWKTKCLRHARSIS